MLKSRHRVVTQYRRLCQDVNKDLTAANVRQIILYVTDGLCEVNRLVDVERGELLSKETICRMTEYVVEKARKKLLLRWGDDMEQETEAYLLNERKAFEAWTQGFAAIPCVAGPNTTQSLQEMKTEALQQKNPVASFRVLVTRKLGEDLRGIHLFEWDGTPRKDLDAIIFAICHYEPTKKGMSTAKKALIGVGSAVALGTAAGLGVYGYRKSKAVDPNKPPLQKVVTKPPQGAIAQFWDFVLGKDPNNITTIKDFKEFLTYNFDEINNIVNFKPDKTRRSSSEFLARYGKKNFLMKNILNDLSEVLEKHKKKVCLEPKGLNPEEGTQAFLEWFRPESQGVINTPEDMEHFFNKEEQNIIREIQKHYTKETFKRKFQDKKNCEKSLRKFVERFGAHEIGDFPQQSFPEYCAKFHDKFGKYAQTGVVNSIQLAGRKVTHPFGTSHSKTY